MPLKKLFIISISATLFFWLLWVFVIFSFDPRITNWIGFMLFYLSLGLALIGTATMLGFLARFYVLRQKLAFRSVAEAFRQSFFFSLLILSSLFLLAHNLFSWLNVILLVVGLSVFEYLLVSFKKT